MMMPSANLALSGGLRPVGEDVLRQDLMPDGHLGAVMRPGVRNTHDFDLVGILKGVLGIAQAASPGADDKQCDRRHTV